MLFYKKFCYIWLMMKLFREIFRTYFNTINTIMCNTRMQKQYVYVKKSTPKNKIKQRF